MPEVGALIAGVGTYRYAGAERLPPLVFTNADADGIERYIATCWPEAGSSVVVRVAESDATVAGLSAGFAHIAGVGPLELLLVFLSGHGLVTEPHVGFLAQPADGAEGYSLLDPATLDRLLRAIDAKRTVVILDCCFAEGIVCRMSFFAGLGGDMARLYVASSRETQRTWEDERAQHGVFTAHLLDLLNSGSSARLGREKEELDVDGELFPVLCEQVPLYVYSTKTQVQEPVKGGVSSAQIKLPVARAARRLRERTALGTALLRVRQIASGAAAFAAGMLLFAYTMLYYIEGDASGSLVVRRGTRWLEPVFRFLPMTRVDTGIGADELSVDPAASHSLEGGYTTGVWTHKTTGSYRSWFEAIEQGLQPAAALRYRVLVGAPIPPAFAQDGEPRPAEVEAASWRAMSMARADYLTAVFRYLPVDRSLPLVSSFRPDKLDFDVLDRSAEDMQAFAKALDYAAAIDPVRTLPEYLAFAKSTQEWLAHNTDAQRGRDARAHVRSAVADVLGVVARARHDRGIADLDHSAQTAIAALDKGGYSEIMTAAISRIAGAVPSAEAALEAFNLFKGDPSDPDQARALEEVMVGLNGSPASRAAANAVYERFVAAGNRMNGYLSRFLIVAAHRNSLSPLLVGALMVEVRASLAKRERDFFDFDLARVMSHAMGSVPPGEREAAYRLIELATRDVTPMSETTAEMYGAFARQHLDRPSMLVITARQAMLAPPFRAGIADPVDGMPGMTIVVGRGPWIAALAEFGRTRRLPPADVAILRSHLDDPKLHDLILPALVVQETVIAGSGGAVQRWVNEIAAGSTDSTQRRARGAIIATILAAMPRSTFLDCVQRLRATREVEAEPEIRIAIGRIISDATYWRVRPSDAGLELFQ